MTPLSPLSLLLCFCFDLSAVDAQDKVDMSRISNREVVYVYIYIYKKTRKKKRIIGIEVRGFKTHMQTHAKEKKSTTFSGQKKRIL